MLADALEVSMHDSYPLAVRVRRKVHYRGGFALSLTWISTMAWILLTIAGALEICWAVALKYSDGFSRPVPASIAIVSFVASMVLLALAVRRLPIGTAYAVWTGIGAVGTALLGVYVLGETLNLVQMASIALIVGGIVGLKVLG
jgi:quaternary ammonium compound-resistance protein SugE